MNACAAVTAGTMAANLEDNNVESASMHSNQLDLTRKKKDKQLTEVQSNSFSFDCDSAIGYLAYLKFGIAPPPTNTVNHQSWQKLD